MNLGNVYAESGNAAKAEEAYLLALQMEPNAIGARVNLADLYRQHRRDGDAERLLRDGIALDDQSAVLHHTIGLVLVRAKKPEAALVELARAADLDTENNRYVHVYAVALNSLGEPQKAIEVLEKAHETFPADYNISWALATMYRDVGRTIDARAAAERLASQFPDDQNIRSLLESL
jgi:tetratricopeptide (TPR) repeat protein